MPLADFAAAYDKIDNWNSLSYRPAGARQPLPR